MFNLMTVLEAGIATLKTELLNQRAKSERLEARVVELEASLHELEGAAAFKEQLESSVKTNQELTSMLAYEQTVLAVSEARRSELEGELESCVRTNQELTARLARRKTSR